MNLNTGRTVCNQIPTNGKDMIPMEYLFGFMDKEEMFYLKANEINV